METKAEISRKLGESFDVLAMAATEKAEIHDSQAVAIAMLTVANSTLVATNTTLMVEVKKLTAEIVRLKAQFRTSSGQDRDDPGGTAQQAKNTLVKMCAVRKGAGGQRGNANHFYLKAQQYCKHCKTKVWHVPANCPNLLENKKDEDR